MQYHAFLVLTCLALAACKKEEPKEKLPDSDGDGMADHYDCAPDDPTRHENAVEICDQIDQDCDDQVDEGLNQSWYADTDGDGFGDPGRVLARCDQPKGHVTDNTDCDDTSADARPGGTEVCDGLDNDCNTIVDDAEEGQEWHLDEDGDGWAGDKVVEACSPPKGVDIGVPGDCDDGDDEIFPGQFDTCNDGIDADCNEDDTVCQLPVASTAHASFIGAKAGDAAGWVLGGGPDITGDGLADIAQASAGFGKYKGAIDIWSGLPAPGEHMAQDGVARIVGEAELLSVAGASVAIMDDLTQDGTPDLVAGAYEVYGGSAKVYIFSGPITGDLDISGGGWDGAFSISGSFATSWGSGFGDLSGDGVTDFAFGDSIVDGGVVYIVRGPLSGTITTQAQIVGDEKGMRLGWMVSALGDHDADGISDLIIGSANGTYIIPGDTTGLGVDASDVALSHMGPSSDNVALGFQSVPVGDVNGDGYDDYATSDYDWWQGAVYIVHGPTAGEIDRTEATGLVYGALTTSRLGIQMASGDIDGDGVVDVLASEWGGWDSSGAAVVIPGDFEGIAFAGEFPYLYHELNPGMSESGGITAVPDLDGDGGMELLLGAASWGAGAGRADLLLSSDIF